MITQATDRADESATRCHTISGTEVRIHAKRGHSPGLPRTIRTFVITIIIIITYYFWLVFWPTASFFLLPIIVSIVIFFFRYILNSRKISFAAKTMKANTYHWYRSAMVSGGDAVVDGRWKVISKFIFWYTLCGSAASDRGRAAQISASRNWSAGARSNTHTLANSLMNKLACTHTRENPARLWMKVRTAASYLQSRFKSHFFIFEIYFTPSDRLRFINF